MEQATKKIYPIIIIGSGPTGLYGLFYTSINHIETLCLEINNSYGGAPIRLYPDKPLYDIPGHVQITGAELVNNMYQQIINFDTWTIKYNTDLKKINTCHDEEGKLYYELIDKKQNHYYARNIIFATGYGSFEFISFDEGVEINQDIKINYYSKDLNHHKDRHVVVCGGGDSAVDYANSLKKIAKSVSLIHRREEFKAKPANVQQLLINANVHTNKTIIKVEQNYIHFKDNKNNKIDKCYFDDLFILYGSQPIASNIDMDKLFNRTHKIEVNPLTLESVNYQNIYACGLATNIKQQQTIITGINDIIRVIAKIKTTL